MTTYVQYDESGNISATVKSVGIAAPDYARQLTFEDTPDLGGKMVDIDNKVLIDIPN